MKRPISIFISALALLAVFSCNKDKIDPSSPVGRQWVCLEDDVPIKLFDIGSKRVVDKDIVSSNLFLTELVYEDSDVIDVKSVTKIKDDSIEGDIWKIEGENRVWESDEVMYVFEVTAEGAKMKYDLSHGEEYTYRFLPRSPRITAATMPGARLKQSRNTPGQSTFLERILQARSQSTTQIVFMVRWMI